jgi:hypothetical protein
VVPATENSGVRRLAHRVTASRRYA